MINEAALDNYYDEREVLYYIVCFDSDGAELGFIHGVDYEDLAEQTRKMPEFRGQVMYELNATVDGEEVNGKVSGNTAEHCLEGFMKVEAAVNEHITERFYELNEVDYDAMAKEAK